MSFALGSGEERPHTVESVGYGIAVFIGQIPCKVRCSVVYAHYRTVGGFDSEAAVGYFCLVCRQSQIYRFAHRVADIG